MMVRYAVFLEPKGALAKQLGEDKRAVERSLPGQVYCGHPPHATIYCAALSSKHLAIDHLREVTQGIDPFEVVSQKMIVFENDVLAGGGHTIAYVLESGPALWHSQLAVAKSLSTLRVRDEGRSGAAAEFRGNAVMAKSMDEYGFPFVGEHWIPHMTIASLKTDKDHPLLQSFLSRQFHYTEQINSLSLWRVEGDVHERLETFELKGHGA